ncbi:MAG: mobilization protein [Sulfurimonas sp.]|nr:mobilization protein [Sulfurimonas sp.]
MTEEQTNKKRKAVSRHEQIQQLKAKVTKLEAMERNQAKKIDTRRKILAGSYLINKYIENTEGLAKLLDSFLVRDNDRELFGLEPLKKAIKE